MFTNNYCSINRCFKISFQQLHYPVGSDDSLSGTQATVMSDNYGLVSQLQALEFHLDTSVRLCRDSIAAARNVFIEFQDVKAIGHARVCMWDNFSSVMHNYHASKNLDPWYVNSVIVSLQ